LLISRPDLDSFSTAGKTQYQKEDTYYYRHPFHRVDLLSFCIIPFYHTSNSRSTVSTKACFFSFHRDSFSFDGQTGMGGIAMTDKEYEKLVEQTVPKSPILKDCLGAFIIGGLICSLGQAFIQLYTRLGMDPEKASTVASLSLVLLSALLTGLSLYDNIAKYAGAGTLVPITGFANSIAATAVEFKTEGFILGVGAKMFTIAGPVIVYGVSASVVYGLIYWITMLF
jgi:stage V sporulation protein AC